MDELRTKHKSLQNAAHHIGLDYVQPSHASPYHVHPYPSPVRLQHAFQPHHSPNMFHPKGLPKSHMALQETSGLRNGCTPSESPVLGRALYLTPRGSPVPGRVSQLSDKLHDSLTLASDTDALAAKINAMFPTVSETHIKILLKKYYNREAVVISALQVEKHPITTPGPLYMSPSIGRLQKSAMGVYSALQLSKGVSGSAQITPLTGTPHGSPSLLRPASGASSYYYGSPRSVDGATPRPHPSPKMKLRYLKSFFPKAEETIILDILANKDNNVQQASEELMSMGFSRREPTPAPQPREAPAPAPPPKQIVMTLQEKENLKKKLQKKYCDIAERVVSIALESVEYNEQRAEQILTVVQQEDVDSKRQAPDTRGQDLTDKPALPTTSNSLSAPISSEKQAVVSPDSHVAGSNRSRAARAPIPSSTRRHKNWTDHMKPAIVLFSGLEKSFKSRFGISSTGPNPELRKGPKDCLLLEDYMTWNGPNPELRSEMTAKADGPEQRAAPRSGLARGANTTLAHGPAKLAKGSIYQKLNKKSVKMCF